MKKGIIVGLFVVIAPLVLNAQDTIRVLHYNLLVYGASMASCNQTNNNVDLKDQYLNIIINHTRPDIFTVNELGRGPTGNPSENAQRILNNVLNTGGRTFFRAASYTNQANQSIANMLFFNGQRFRLHSEQVIAVIERDINLYRLYLNNPAKLVLGDTTYLNLIVSHFKAGSTADDQQTRLSEANAVMSFIESRNLTGNVMFLADFNMKSAYEIAFQTLTFHPNTSIRFHDPVTAPGNWFENPDVARYHTQSTRTSTPACFITGGMDDRFDLILLSNALIWGTRGLQYVEGSYHVVGQDGVRLNRSLIDPVNTSAPMAVIEALYNMSDHLPVGLQLVTRPAILSSDRTIFGEPVGLHFNNPVRDFLNLRITGFSGMVEVSVYSVTGNRMLTLSSQQFYEGAVLRVDVSNLTPGIYLVRVASPKIAPMVKMLLKH
jgi:hypothetical protein